MTEQALQQYLIKQYPKEDEGCEWKEFKNLKNDFSGHEKDDVISYVSALANMEGGHLVVGVEDKTLKIVGTDTYNYTTQQATLRLTNLCANLSSEGLDIEEFITEDAIAHQDYTMQERVTMVETPDSVTFSNGGYFLPGSVRNAIEQTGPQKYYRNYALCQDKSRT